MTLIDTPGVSWQPRAEPKSEEAQKFRAHDILVRSRGRVDKMKDPVPAGTLLRSSESKGFNLSILPHRFT